MDYLPVGSGKPNNDIESGLYPGIDATDNMLRWGFVRKVYGIISMQLLLTAVVAGAVVLNSSLQHFLLGSIAVQIVLMIFSMLLLVPLYMYKDQHPLNLALLAAWTAVMGTTVGCAVSFYPSFVVLEAVALTAAVVVGLTSYTFYATKRGVEFTWMGPMLFGCLWALVIWSFIQLIWPPGPVGSTIFSLLGAVLFSAYLVFDTHLLIARVGMDDYVWASVSIYLDILNLFLYILRILGQSQRNN